MDNLDTGFSEFAAAFNGEDGNQTEIMEEPAAEETAEDVIEDTPEETETEPEDGEPEENDPAEEEDNPTSENQEEPEKQEPEQKFTIKVNKESREVSLQEMTELAQKGADYDRVKGQLETTRQSEQSLQEELSKQKPFMEFLTMAAEQAGVTKEQLVENLHVNLLKSKGMSEAEAKAEIRAAKAEKQVKDLTQQKETTEKKPDADSGMARAQRDIEEFAKAFPDVKLTKELVEKLMPDVYNGMTLTSAYLKMENARQAAEIAELQKKQAAAAQNKRNRAKAPGSQQSSGGKTAKSDFDEFAEAFR